MAFLNKKKKWCGVIFYSRYQETDSSIWANPWERIYFTLVGQVYTHCEIIINPFKNGFRIDSNDPNSFFNAYTVTKADNIVNMKRRLTNNFKYQWLYLNITDKQIETIENICRSYLKSGLSYDYNGLWRSYVYPIEDYDRGTWCSHFVATVLKEARLLPNEVDPAAITSDELYNLIKMWCSTEIDTIPANTFRDIKINRVRNIHPRT